MSLDQIPHLHLPELELFRRDFEKPRRPVVITGAMDGWRALARWTPEYFSRQLGGVPVQVITSEVAKDGEALTPEELIRTKVEKVKMRDYLEEVAAGPVRRYVSGMAMQPTLSFLMDDIRPPIYREEGSTASPRIWIGRLVGPLHYDHVDNLHGIVYGRKRITLFAPEDLRYLYPSSIFSFVPTMSRANLSEADRDQFPRLRKAKPLVVELEPGQMLFIPAGWWHQVTTPVLSISIDFPWTQAPKQGWPFLRLAIWRALVRFRGRLGASGKKRAAQS